MNRMNNLQISCKAWISMSRIIYFLKIFLQSFSQIDRVFEVFIKSVTILFLGFLMFQFFAGWDLAPNQRQEPKSLKMGRQSLNHWTGWEAQAPFFTHWSSHCAEHRTSIYSDCAYLLCVVKLFPQRDPWSQWSLSVLRTAGLEHLN